MKRLICKFFGHRWAPKSPSQIDEQLRRIGSLNFCSVKMTYCARCGVER